MGWGRGFNPLDTHTLQQHADNPKYFQFACEQPECPRRFDYRAALQDYVADKHTSPPECVIWDVWEEVLDHKNQLDIHKFSHGKHYEPSGKYFIKCPHLSKMGAEYECSWTTWKNVMIWTYKTVTSAMIVKKTSVEIGMEAPAPLKFGRGKERQVQGRRIRMQESSESESSATFDSSESEDSD